MKKKPIKKPVADEATLGDFLFKSASLKAGAKTASPKTPKTRKPIPGAY